MTTTNPRLRKLISDLEEGMELVSHTMKEFPGIRRFCANYPDISLRFYGVAEDDENKLLPTSPRKIRYRLGETGKKALDYDNFVSIPLSWDLEKSFKRCSPDAVFYFVYNQEFQGQIDVYVHHSRVGPMTPNQAKAWEEKHEWVRDPNLRARRKKPVF